MGTTISSPQGFDEGDLSTKGKKDTVDPILEKLRSLHVVTPVLKLQTTDVSLTEILLRRSSSEASECTLTATEVFWNEEVLVDITPDLGSVDEDNETQTKFTEWLGCLSDLLHVKEALDPTSTVKLFELYQEWQRATATKVGKNQEELGYKIIGVEELSMKLLQRLNYACRVMEAGAAHLHEVHSLQDEILEMKRKLTKTLENYEKLSQKVDALGLQKRNIKPMAIVHPPHQGKDDTDAIVASPSEASHISATVA